MITKDVVELVKFYTDGTFDITTLTGRRNRDARQKIIEAITRQNHPKSCCYISRVRGLLMEGCNLYDKNNIDCLAVLEKKLIKRLKSLDVRA